MNTITQNPQTGATVQVGMIDVYNPQCPMNTQKIQILDAKTQQPLAGAHIVNRSITPISGTTSDNNGYFLMKNLTVKDISNQIEVSYIGYTTQRLTVKVLQGVSTIGLQPNTTQLEEVTVTGSLNEKVKTSSKWLWGGLLILTGGLIYAFSRKEKPKKVNV